MAYFQTLVYLAVACIFVGAEDIDALNSNKREPRHLTNKLCYKFGICGGGYQGGFGGYQGGFQGGYQGGYQGYPPINIGISQSQTSSSAGGGGYGSANYPNNYQYNNGYNGYPNNGYHGYNNRPGYFGNGFGSNNNQFNGNYYNGQGGYGFQKPYYDDVEKPIYEDYDGDYERSNKD